MHIGPRGQEILLRYLARDLEAYCFRPADSEAKRRAALHATRKTPLSCGNRPGSNRRRTPRKLLGDSYTTSSYRRAIARGCDKAFLHPTLDGVPVAKMTVPQIAEFRRWQSDHCGAPNQLRHAAATEVRRAFGLEAAQSSSVTAKIYAERMRKLRDAVAMLNAVKVLAVRPCEFPRRQ